MTIELLPDGWEVVEPFIPVVEAKHKGGRPLVADGAGFTALYSSWSGISFGRCCRKRRAVALE